MLFRSARGVAASVAAVFAAELLLFVVLAGRFGLLQVSVVAGAVSLAGVWYVIRSAPGVIARSYQDIAAAAAPVSVDGGADRPAADQALADRVLRMAGALLVAFPGLLTGLIGSVLFVGPVRALLAPSLGSRLSSLLPAGIGNGHGFRRRRDVVDATSSIKDPARPPESAAHSEQAFISAPAPEQP